jgi:hypothetical protein
MRYLKGIAVGLAAAFSAAITFPFVFAFVAIAHARRVAGPDQMISWDLRSALGNPLFFWGFRVTVLFFFGVGFWVGFRKLSR